MIKNNITKGEWTDRTRSALEWAVSILLEETQTPSLRLVILESIPEVYTQISTCQSTTYKRDQKYEFLYLGKNGDVSKFGVYQKRMSLRNSGKAICLNENQPIKDLSHEEARCYNDAIVNFVMANIVWE